MISTQSGQGAAAAQSERVAHECLGIHPTLTGFVNRIGTAWARPVGRSIVAGGRQWRRTTEDGVGIKARVIR
jgi:hypothetical protein